MLTDKQLEMMRRFHGANHDPSDQRVILLLNEHAALKREVTLLRAMLVRAEAIKRVEAFDREHGDGG